MREGGVGDVWRGMRDGGCQLQEPNGLSTVLSRLISLCAMRLCAMRLCAMRLYHDTSSYHCTAVQTKSYCKIQTNWQIPEIQFDRRLSYHNFQITYYHVMQHNCYNKSSIVNVERSPFLFLSSAPLFAHLWNVLQGNNAFINLRRLCR